METVMTNSKNIPRMKKQEIKETLKVYNTMSRKKEKFIPIKKGKVSIYNCGPTVYDFAHIGNFRTYIFADVLRRYLEYKGYDVSQVMNITDVGHMTVDDVADAKGEDKIEKKAKQEKKTPEEISEFYTKAFLKDWKSLNLMPPMNRPKATDYIKQMIEIIEKLIKKGHAYVSNGSVYFHVPSFKEYGKLSGNNIEKLLAGAGGRVEDNPDKKHPLDFALWVKNPKHLLQWDSPWGKGYPGWHIECSAMSMYILGKTIDIHTGGEDNIFPHHDCEIAQSVCANDTEFVRYWMHARHIMVDGKKMSKSLGNFYTLKDLKQKGFEPLAVRYLLVSAHYRTKLNITDESLLAAKNTLQKIRNFILDISNYKSNLRGETESAKKTIKSAKTGFEKAMDDDLNVPEALSVMFEMMKSINTMISEKKAGMKDIRNVYEAMMDFDSVLGLKLDSVARNATVEDKVKKLVNLREQYRKEKNFRKADEIRDLLKKRGIIVEDSPEGPVIKKA